MARICGIIAGAFDVIHPGHPPLFKAALELCDYLIIALHVDPSIENPSKMKPVLSVQERTDILMMIKNVAGVVVYKTEAELTEILNSRSYDLRIEGSDHKGNPTREGLKIPTYYHNRDHDWSATKFKKMIKDSLS